MIDVRNFKVSIMDTNCYVITDKSTGDTAVVDCGAVSSELTAYLDTIGSDKISYILLTHGHFDHIGGAKEYAERYNARIVISALDEPFLSDESLNLAGMCGCSLPSFSADVVLSDGDIINLGETILSFMLTSGHTQGSGCYISESDRMIFSGDTLFCASMGRTDFPTGNVWDMMKSLRKLRELDGDYDVYPGHDRITTLSYEREHNMYMI